MIEMYDMMYDNVRSGLRPESWAPVTRQDAALHGSTVLRHSGMWSVCLSVTQGTCSKHVEPFNGRI